MYYTVIENGDFTYRIPYASGENPETALRNALKAWVPSAADAIDKLPYKKDADSLLSKIDGGFDFGLAVVFGENRPVLDTNKAGNRVYVKVRRIFSDANYWAISGYEYNPTKSNIETPGILMFRPVVMNDIFESLDTAIAKGIKNKTVETIDDVVLSIAYLLYSIGTTSPTFKEYMQLLNDVKAALPVYALGQGVTGLKFEGVHWIVAPYNFYTVRVFIEKIKQPELIILTQFITALQKAQSFDEIYKLLGVDKYATKVGE